MKNSKARRVTEAALICALYVALTWLSNVVGLASGSIQLRLSEALCVLPYFTSSAIYGVSLGCLISNLTMGALPLDIVVGTIATLIGAAFTYFIRNKWLCPIPSVLSNTLLIPVVITVTVSTEWSWGLYFVSLAGVFIGEFISVYVLGILLIKALEKRKLFKR